MASSKIYESQYGRFEKLNKINYKKWQISVMSVLKSLRALQIVTREEAAHHAGNSQAAQARLVDYEARYAQVLQYV